MAINTRKRPTKKETEASPKKVKAEDVKPTVAVKGKKTPVKAAAPASANGSPSPQKKSNKKENQVKGESTNGSSNASSPAKKKAQKKKSGNKKGKPKEKITTPSAETLALKKKTSKEAAEYLNKWENDKTNWKFNKNTQSWIVAHVFDTEMVPESSFDTACNYFESAVGNVRTRLTENALRKIKKIEEETEETDQVVLDRAQRLVKLGSAEKKAATKAKAATPAKTPAGKAKTPQKAKTPAKTPTKNTPSKDTPKKGKKTPQKKTPAKKEEVNDDESDKSN